MPNPDKTFWRYMHQKPSYKFNAGKGKFFPLSFVPVIFYRKSNVSIVHADDAVIADGNPMGILSKVVNHRLCAVKRFLTIRNPFRDKYYYSLDLNYYLNNLEDDAYEA